MTPGIIVSVVVAAVFIIGFAMGDASNRSTFNRCYQVVKTADIQFEAAYRCAVAQGMVK